MPGPLSSSAAPLSPGVGRAPVRPTPGNPAPRQEGEACLGAGCKGTRHGNEDAYVNHGCTCLTARADHARRTAQRDRLRLAGTPSLVDATATRERLLELVAAGWDYSDLGEMLGVTRSAVYLLIRRRAQVHRETERRVAELHASVLPADDVDEVALERAMHGDPVTLTRTEIDTAIFRLTEQGVSAIEIARRLRVNPRTVQRRRAARDTEGVA